VARPQVTVRDLRRANRAALLRLLFLSGPLTRVALGEMTGLSSASVTNVVTDLLGEGLVVEVGTEESDGGRPRVQLQINPDFGVAVGVDIGETGIRIEAFDLAMREVGKAVLDIHPQEFPADVVIEHIVLGVREALGNVDPQPARILGVGVGVPGVAVHSGASLVHAPNIQWQGVPLATTLNEALDVPVFVDNGAKTLGQAEMWFGAGRDTHHAVVALLGTGVGAAIFANGSLYSGATSSAGEWGHMSVVVNGRRCRCGGSGCLEAYVGAEALFEQWAEGDTGVSVPGEHDQEEWMDRLIAASPTSRSAAYLLEQTAVYLGVGMANLVNLFNPERIVIAGWSGLKLGPVLIERIREVVAKQALAYPASRVSIELGQLGRDAVALGASTLVMDRLLGDGGRLPARPTGGRRTALQLT
jgi:predicted NBD/HSP70 family sugar kinase